MGGGGRIDDVQQVSGFVVGIRDARSVGVGHAGEAPRAVVGVLDGAGQGRGGDQKREKEKEQ